MFKLGKKKGFLPVNAIKGKESNTRGKKAKSESTSSTTKAKVVKDSKKCTNCGVIKPLSSFYKGAKEGYVRSVCKDCMRAQRKADYNKNAAKEREWASNYRKTNAKNVQKAKESFFEKNPDYNKEYMRKYRAKKKQEAELAKSNSKKVKSK